MNAPEPRQDSNALRSSLEIKNLIADLHTEQFSLPTTQSPAILEAEISKLTTRTLLDPNLKPDLHEATLALEAANDIARKRAVIRQKMELLNSELEQALTVERINAANDADNRLRQAIGEFKTVGVQLIRAYRRCLTIALHNRRVPGASIPVLPRFNLPFTHQANSQAEFHTSTIMETSLLPFEADEQRQQEQQQLEREAA